VHHFDADAGAMPPFQNIPGCLRGNRAPHCSMGSADPEAGHVVWSTYRCGPRTLTAPTDHGRAFFILCMVCLGSTLARGITLSG
jgi:hypothetical protein